MSKLSKIFIAIAMLLTMIVVPKMEVKASAGEQVTPYSTTVPVSATKAVYPVSNGEYPYVNINLTGTMVRGSDKNVTSYSLSMSRTIKNSNDADWEITSATITSKSYAASGTGVIGYFTVEIELESLTNGAVKTITKSGSVTCGV